MTSIKLKPRPFCGGKARLFATEDVKVVMCTNTSKILTDDIETTVAETAIKAWNRRTEVRECDSNTN